MQSGYGVSEMQQFAGDGIFPSPPVDVSQPQKHHHHSIHPHPLSFFQHHQQQQQQQEEYHPRQLHFQEHHSPTPSFQPRFPPHFHQPVPITHQLFHQTSHQFQRFQHHLSLDNGDSRHADNSASPSSSIGIDVRNRIGVAGAGTASGGNGGGRISAFLGPSMTFRLSVNENADELNNDDGVLHGVEVDGSETRWPLPSTSRGEVESSIKEPFWRPLDLEMDYINRNNKRCKEIHQEKQRENEQEHEQGQEPEQDNMEIESSGGSKQFKEMKEVTNGDADSGANTGSNYKLFSELEAICKSRTTTAISLGKNNNNQTGSSSALTGENLPITMGDPSLMDDDNPSNHVAPTSEDASTGDEAFTGNGMKKVSDERSKKRKRRRSKREKKKKKQLRSIAVFFESLVKQLIDHQEALHMKFLRVLEKREEARMTMEKIWRHQDADKSRRQLKAREEQRAISEAREATIVSFLEKMTGESINFSTERFRSLMELKNQSHGEAGEGEDTEISNENNENSRFNSNRWPKAEVQDLIRVRSGLESRFQEPGLKGPLWEEVSMTMSSMGYRRNSKRCKEKWENINKYFRKTKESAKKRSKQSNTCPYFHQLDQLYSKNKINLKNDRPEQRCHSELLYSIVASNDQPPPFNYSDMNPVPFAASNNYTINTVDDDLNIAAPTTEMPVSGHGGLLNNCCDGDGDVDGDKTL